MAPIQSNLEKYGYDFVVSTTQESINAGLLQYLQNTNGEMEPMTMIFLQEKGKAKGDPLSLKDFLALPNTTDPFKIPSGTPWEETKEVTNLYKAGFVCAIRLQLGIPPGMVREVPGKGHQIVLPTPIVTLGSSAESVLFTMYCSELTVISSKPPSGWGDDKIPGSWTWYSQQPGQPWYVQTRTSLLTKPLDPSLGTEYYNQRPEEQERLLAQLDALKKSGATFSLQQLLFDLDNAKAQSNPELAGVAETDIKFLLGTYFITIWAAHAKRKGQPLLGVQAVVQSKDPGSLEMTAMDRYVSPVVNPETGAKLAAPGTLEQKATTLNYLCTTGNNPIPAAAAFNWNWVEPSQLGQASGTIAIRRSTLAKYLVKQIMDQAISTCWKPIPKLESPSALGDIRYSLSLEADQQPTVTYNDSGPLVATINWKSKEGRSKDLPGSSSKGEFNVWTTYNCDITLGDTTGGARAFIIEQHLIIHAYMQVLATGTSANVFDKVIKDVYNISVDGHGKLESKRDESQSQETDNSKGGDRSGLVNLFTDINDWAGTVKSQIGNYTKTRLTSFPFEGLKSFVFPGGRVFSYKSAEFSKHQDLCTLITYVNPTKDQFSVGSARLDNGGTQPAQASQSGANGTINGKINLANADSSSTSSVKLSSSTEIMLNYVQGELVDPRGKFRALQVAEGHALLFATNSAGAFTVIEESTGQSATGWTVKDLSSKVVQESFPGGKVHAFDVAQSVVDREGSIGMGMAVRTNGSDTLHLSLLNSSKTTSWTSAPAWKSYPFDAPEAPTSIRITNIYFSETTERNQYIVVDILRDPTSALKDTARYIVDPSSTTTVWRPHKLPFDVAEGTYQSCTGRVRGALADGIYTAGMIGTAGQLAYVPIFNSSGDAAPMPTRLALPDGLIATAIAAARNDSTSKAVAGTTDLFVVAGSTLYHWSPEEQFNDNTSGKALLSSPVLSGTDSLIAMTKNGMTTIFGRNASNTVWYTSCSSQKVKEPDAWGVIVPILADVESISSYINCCDGGNTVYAAGGNKIQQLIQATDTASQIWQVRPVMLTAPPQSKSLSFNSYTSTIQARDNDLPADGIAVTLTTRYRTPVYINGLYYILSSTPVTVRTDASGEFTIIQATESVVGAVIEATAGSSRITVDPLKKTLTKIAGFTNVDAIRNAQVTTNTKAGGVVGNAETKPLVSPSVSDADLLVVAKSIEGCKKAWHELSDAASMSHLGQALQPLATLELGDIDLDKVLDMSPGDLFAWLKTGVEKVVRVVKDTATGVWQFIVEVAGKAYRAVLSTFEAVVGAIEWCFTQIKVSVNELLKYLRFLFDWNDILRTKRIMHNMIKYYLQDVAGDIKRLQSIADQNIEKAQQQIAQLTGNKQWKSLGDVASRPPQAKAVEPAKEQSASSQHLAGHYKAQAQHMTYKQQAEAETGLLEKFMASFTEAVENAGEVLKETRSQLELVILDFPKLTLEEIIVRLLGIIANTALGGTQVVIDALFGALHALTTSALAVLDAKIHIPVISDILADIGMPEFSFLDLLTWIAAQGYTVMYKLAKDKAPFPDNNTTQALAGAQNFAELSSALKAAPTRMVAHGLYAAGHGLSALLRHVSSPMLFAVAMDDTGATIFGKPNTVLSTLAIAAAKSADALVEQMPIESVPWQWTSRCTSAVSLYTKLVFGITGMAYKGPPGGPSPVRSIQAIADSILVLPALACTCWHFHELSGKPESKARTRAIIGEVANLSGHIRQFLYTATVLDPVIKTKAIKGGLMMVANHTVIGLELSLCIMEQSD
ncbi:hypothetical protein AMS68_003371 [Peltaster fructicola]|uniref:Uncharacterized protein n=1 Tax=Peltaster fructicola TaxID=286661 RepID=A0A6H0XSZ3_9PEZI|nr:hypothetical protein AMS68_003371 [Peltaster fructicola]